MRKPSRQHLAAILFSSVLPGFAMSCGGAAAPTAVRPATPAAPSVAVAARPGFVVHTESLETIVIEVDGTVAKAPGYWLPDGDAVKQLLFEDQPELFGLPRCGCVTNERACINSPIVREIQNGAARFPSCGCYGDENVEVPTDDCSLGGDTEDCVCREQPGALGTPLSSIGGEISFPTHDENSLDSCNADGINTYDASQRKVHLRATRPRYPVSGPYTMCDQVELDIGIASVVEGDELQCACATGGSAGEDMADEDMDDGERFMGECQPDTRYLARAEHMICEIGYAMSSVGEEAGFGKCAPLTPDTCPSAVDTCGDPAPFALPPGEPSWVATNGSFALTMTDVRPAGGAPIAFSLPDASFNALGVYFLDDLDLLLAAFPGPPCDENDCASRDATCVLGICRPLCERDAECDGASCVEGVCDGLASPPECDAEDEPDVRDEDELDAEAEDAAEPCDDALDATDLGNACFRAFRADQLDEAERLCRCGLARSPSSNTRGALFYNLGRVEEERGDHEAARERYQESLESRDNAAVRRRLESL